MMVARCELITMEMMQLEAQYSALNMELLQRAMDEGKSTSEVLSLLHPELYYGDAVLASKLLCLSGDYENGLNVLTQASRDLRTDKFTAQLREKYSDFAAFEANIYMRDSLYLTTDERGKLEALLAEDDFNYSAWARTILSAVDGTDIPMPELRYDFSNDEERSARRVIGQEEQPIRTLRVRPNPASNVAVVDLKDYLLTAQAVEVRDQTGRPLAKYSIDNGQTELVLDLRPLSSGVYFIVVSDIGGNTLTTERLLKLE